MSLLHLLEEGLRIEALVFTHVDLLSRVPAGPAEPEPELVLSSSQVQLWVPLKGCLFFFKFSTKADLFDPIFCNKAACVNNKHDHGCRGYASPSIGVDGDPWADRWFHQTSTSFSSRNQNHPGVRSHRLLTSFPGIKLIFFFFFFSPGKFHLYHNIERH